ncbi:hypothetical protein CEPID_05305 [Corynebacterium epidermidicanis]|uniref:Uncharacterized protein n=1 Tax=Corynebacterium epidermidicanis TaxID=1050174 RepID=A0A0G3GQT0_9CORY|nr:hypothetical protein CEPID_05305 [Corynebacterium epidermidicanis]
MRKDFRHLRISGLRDSSYAFYQPAFLKGQREHAAGLEPTVVVVNWGFRSDDRGQTAWASHSGLQRGSRRIGSAIQRHLASAFGKISSSFNRLNPISTLINERLPHAIRGIPATHNLRDKQETSLAENLADRGVPILVVRSTLQNHRCRELVRKIYIRPQQHTIT